MPGRDPKPAALRRRRNKGETVGVVRLVDEGGRRAPNLPGRKWVAQTRSWWRTIWASPMSQVWLDGDVPALVRLARLVDLVNRGDHTASILGEIRQLEDRFGLSPLARRRLTWELEQANPGKGESTAKPDDAEAKEKEDRWLRAVSD